MTLSRRFAIFVFGLAAVALTACGVPEEPEGAVHLLAPSFSGVEEMAIHSDLVVLGTVEKIEPGRKIGRGVEELQYRDVYVKVEDEMFSRLNSPSNTVITQEIGWMNGKVVEPADWPWSKEGDRGYFFLQKDIDARGKYGYLGPQAHILIEDDTLHSSGEHEAKAVAEMNASTPDNLEEQIQAAAAKIKTEGIPNPPGYAMGEEKTP